MAGNSLQKAGEIPDYYNSIRAAPPAGIPTVKNPLDNRSGTYDPSLFYGPVGSVNGGAEDHKLPVYPGAQQPLRSNPSQRLLVGSTHPIPYPAYPVVDLPLNQYTGPVLDPADYLRSAPDEVFNGMHSRKPNAAGLATIGSSNPISQPSGDRYGNGLQNAPKENLQGPNYGNFHHQNGPVIEPHGGAFDQARPSDNKTIQGTQARTLPVTSHLSNPNQENQGKRTSLRAESGRNFNSSHPNRDYPKPWQSKAPTSNVHVKNPSNGTRNPPNRVEVMSMLVDAPNASKNKLTNPNSGNSRNNPRKPQHVFESLNEYNYSAVNKPADSVIQPPPKQFDSRESARFGGPDNNQDSAQDQENADGEGNFKNLEQAAERLENSPDPLDDIEYQSRINQINRSPTFNPTDNLGNLNQPTRQPQRASKNDSAANSTAQGWSRGKDFASTQAGSRVKTYSNQLGEQ